MFLLTHPCFYMRIHVKSPQVSKQNIVTSCCRNSRGTFGSAAAVWGRGSVPSAGSTGGHLSVTQLADVPAPQLLFSRTYSHHCSFSPPPHPSQSQRRRHVTLLIQPSLLLLLRRDALPGLLKGDRKWRKKVYKQHGFSHNNGSTTGAQDLSTHLDYGLQLRLGQR